MPITQFDQYYGKYRLTPSIVFGKALITYQFAVTAMAPVLVISASNARFYVVINNDPTQTIFIGSRNVTLQSGFALKPSSQPLIFAMAENAELWAIASGPTTLFLLDMGV
jgi:hypothetical protein